MERILAHRSSLSRIAIVATFAGISSSSYAAPAVAQDAAPPPPSVSLEDRLANLRRDLARERKQTPPNARALEAICTAWQPRRLYDLAPTMKAELAICAARAAYLADRTNVFEKRLEVALALTSGDANSAAEIEMQAQANLLRAEADEKSYREFERCGTELGLVRLRKFEASEMRRRLDLAVSHYKAVLGIGSPKAEARAVGQIARLYDDFYRRTALKKPVTYRGVSLPSPFIFLSLRTSETLSENLAPSTSPWPREIRRLYDIATQQAREQQNTDEAATLIKERDALADDTALDQEQATAPWKKTLPAGVIRLRRGNLEQRNRDGKWHAVDREAAIKTLTKAAKVRPLDIVGGFAVAALADLGRSNEADVLAAVASDIAAVRFAGLYAMEKAPVPTYKNALLAAWTRGETERPKNADRSVRPLFGTLQDAVYGLPERTLLALRALVTRERDVALDLTYTRLLPMDERAWLIAELGDTRTRYRVIELVQTGDTRTQAVSLYGTYLSNGERALYMLRQYKNGLPACVARNTLGLHSERERRLEISNLSATP